jgi:IS5 family transposase
MMFKVLVLQALYGLSDDQAEFMINDRLSFMRFLGLGFEDDVPDAKTIWLFRELLVEAKPIDKLFALFDRRLAEKGYLAMGGQIIDAPVVESPRQHNPDGEKRDIKKGKVPGDWKDSPAKLAQKDMDARWTLKRGKKSRIWSSPRWWRSPCRCSATKTTSRRMFAMASSAHSP